MGFDGDAMKLRQLLLREDHQRQMFISILGESGVGKRTLVEMILQEAVLQQLRPGPRMEEALLVQGGDGEGNKQITEEVVQSTSHANLVSARTTAIERVFWASFEDLPNDLKSCFLYFAAFPKNTVTSREQTFDPRSKWALVPEFFCPRD